VSKDYFVHIIIYSDIILYTGPAPKTKTLANEALKAYIRPGPVESDDSDFDIPTNLAQRKSSLKGIVKRTRGKRTAIKHLDAAAKLLLKVLKDNSDKLGNKLFPKMGTEEDFRVKHL
jgi:hypothetical protein